MLLRLAQMLAVALLLEQRQQRRERRAHVTDDAEIDSYAARRSRSARDGVTTGGPGSSPAAFGAGASAAGCKATSPGMTTTDTPRLPIASRMATSRTRGICLAPAMSSQ